MNDIATIYRKFGFSEPPFNQTPDTSFLYAGKQHAAALKHLHYGLHTDGFTLLTGEVGLGKTLLCRQLLRTVGKGIKTVYVYNTYINLIDLLKSIFYDLTGLQIQSKSLNKCFLAINKALIREANRGVKVMVLLDEAQSMEPKVLEGLRLLSNLETEKKKLLSFIMVGQPELEDRLGSYDLRQLEQRISVRYILKPFGFFETREYINHRMALASPYSLQRPATQFSELATFLVHRFSKGVPRRINQICDRALLASFNARKRKIGVQLIRRAALEVLR